MHFFCSFLFVRQLQMALGLSVYGGFILFLELAANMESVWGQSGIATARNRGCCCRQWASHGISCHTTTCGSGSDEVFRKLATAGTTCLCSNEVRSII